MLRVFYFQIYMAICVGAQLRATPFLFALRARQRKINKYRVITNLNPCLGFANRIRQPLILSHRNREIAQYTRSPAIIRFVTFAYLEKRSLNTEPNSDQHRAKAKPINARRSAKKISVSHSP